MKREEFVADEVVSWSQLGRDGGCPCEIFHDLCGSPVCAGERRGGHAWEFVRWIDRGEGRDIPIWSILNHPFPDPSHAAMVPAHLYIHTMTGPWACVHCPHLAVIFAPAATVAVSLAEVPPLHMTFLSVTVIVGL
jgi:hypothetical protein